MQLEEVTERIPEKWYFYKVQREHFFMAMSVFLKFYVAIGQQPFERAEGLILILNKMWTWF